MELAIESILEQRSTLLSTRLQRKRSLVMSISLHLVLALGFALGPILLSQEPEPIEFTPITIVPVQALGVQEPVAPPQRQTPPEPRPEPKPAETRPEPKPDQPQLPATEKAAQKKPDSRPEAGAAVEPEAAPAGSAPETLGQRRGSPTGSSLGTSSFGASVGFDNPDFTYNYYVDQMLAMIGSNWQRPPLGAEIEAVIHFRIHRDGHISDVRIVQSSGYNSYDLAGLRAIQLAAPLPKLPQSFKHGSLGVNLIFR